MSTYDICIPVVLLKRVYVVLCIQSVFCVLGGDKHLRPHRVTSMSTEDIFVFFHKPWTKPQTLVLN